MKSLKQEKTVLILLATYNGAEYLAEQIKSIQAQTHQHWHILIRDDGSSDTTIDVINEFAKDDARIELCSDSQGNLGVVRNFGCLMMAALKRDAQYVAFCDQDDVWEQDKLRKQLKALSELESVRISDCPVLVFSDLKLADDQLTQIGDSYMDHQGITDPGGVKLENLLYQNIVVGNTMLMNSALLKLATPVPEGIHMHDWWTAQCAVACGEVIYISARLVTYRLHGANQVGASGIKTAFNPLKKRWWNILVKMNKLFISSFLQAEHLRRVLNSELMSGKNQYSEQIDRSKSLVDTYLGFLRGDALERLRRMISSPVKSKIPLLNALFGFQLLRPGLIKQASKAVRAATVPSSHTEQDRMI